MKYYKCAKCGIRWSKANNVEVNCCPVCESCNIDYLGESESISKLNASNIVKLSEVCRKLDFESFKSNILYALEFVKADDDYLKEKFEAFRNEGLDWLCHLDYKTAERFLGKLIEKIKG